LEEKRLPSARAANVKTDNPVLPPRFKAAVWVSPKGSSRRFLAVRIGTDAEGRGSTVEPASAVDLDPEKAQSLEVLGKNTLARLYKDGAFTVRTSRSASPIRLPRGWL
jgi:hypothetical protein